MQKVAVKNGSVTLQVGTSFVTLVKGHPIEVPDDAAKTLSTEIYDIEPVPEEIINPPAPTEETEHKGRGGRRRGESNG